MKSKSQWMPSSLYFYLVALTKHQKNDWKKNLTYLISMIFVHKRGKKNTDFIQTKTIEVLPRKGTRFETPILFTIA